MSRRSSMMRVVGIVLFLMAGMWASSGMSVSAQEGDTSLRVMTYNIKHGKGNIDCEDPPATPDVPPAAAECAVDLTRVADVIRAQDPDVVAIQEVDRFWARSGGVDQPAELAEMLGMESCFAPNLDHEADDHADEPHQYGVLILSKSPILSCENTLFPTYEDWEQRGLLEARIDVDGIGEIAVLASHFQAGRSSDPEEAVRQRTESAEITAERAASLDVPVVVMGDLNARPDDPDLMSLLADSGLQDAWAVSGSGDGFTSPASPDEPADARIDYVLVSSQFSVGSASVVVDEATMTAADHYPIVVDLTLVDSGTPSASPEATPVT